MGLFIQGFLTDLPAKQSLFLRPAPLARDGVSTWQSLKSPSDHAASVVAGIFPRNPRANLQRGGSRRQARGCMGLHVCNLGHSPYSWAPGHACRSCLDETPYPAAVVEAVRDFNTSDFHSVQIERVSRRHTFQTSPLVAPYDRTKLLSSILVFRLMVTTSQQRHSQRSSLRQWTVLNTPSALSQWWETTPGHCGSTGNHPR